MTKEQKNVSVRPKETYGQELILNLYGCDLKVINSRKKLEEFAIKICRVIKMKRYGKPLIPFFGLKEPKTAGYSLVQLIETSSITGHFSNLYCSAYLNIFSCMPFNAEKAASFAKGFFRAKEVEKTVLKRQ